MHSRSSVPIRRDPIVDQRGEGFLWINTSPERGNEPRIWYVEALLFLVVLPVYGQANKALKTFHVELLPGLLPSACRVGSATGRNPEQAATLANNARKSYK